MNRIDRLDSVACLVVIAVLTLLPSTGLNEGVMYLVCLIMVWAIFALGYDVAFGNAGILSFGHAAFFGLGGFGLTWAQLELHWTFSGGMVAAAVLGAVCAWLFALLGRRVTGLYFSLLTLMLAELLSILVVTRLRDLSGGADGLPGVPRPVWGDVDFFDNANFYWIVLTVFVSVVAAMWILRHSPLGQALQAVRQNPVRAEQLGFDVQGLRQVAMTISGAVAGIAGGLLAALMMYAGPQMLSWKTSGDVLIMTLLGGSGTLVGPIVGVAFFEILRDVLSAWSDYWYGLVGVVFILCTLYLQRGLAGTVLRRWGRR
jgi:branched-chain amino acid transport system permease protein